MTALVYRSGTVWKGVDGSIARHWVDGEKESFEDRWTTVDALQKPVSKVGAVMNLDDGTEIFLPSRELHWIIPDRTGVLVIFEPGSHTHPDGTDIFPEPNNAAIYNADGSLRFQLRVPPGHIVDRIAAVHGGAIVSPKFKDMMGVLIATDKRGPPEYVYVIDPSQPELISTGQWVRW